ncbi:glycosyltransferase family 32 protein [Hydnum rufescens UP504]|uniref:Glycosyltransferase family 32 protein n=1 Tax=Hydnum rufescens UP504 TaxID=1448309 RepID=A0A9P6E1M8_9AGAM|nr:glycosyltransferase family 32 protein [Hydnum rufescens UP504]
MSKSLPFPTTADLTHARRASPRRIILGLASFLTAAFLITQLASAPSLRIDVERLDRIIEHDTPQTKLGAPHAASLTSLGLEADESYHLGTTDNPKYRSELQDFVTDTFPDKLKRLAIASIDTFVPETGSGTCTRSPSVPPKIWQTSKTRDPDMYHEWKEQPGYSYTFLNDAAADKWVEDHFGGSKVRWAWDVLGPASCEPIFLRYLLLLVEGGIYTDTDTHLLRSIDGWGKGATNYGDQKYPGRPSLIVGIEADVGEREDWHRWWARPVQLCQWTFASTPLHPVLIDAVRRIYEHTREFQNL